MLLASKNGSIIACALVTEAETSWTLKISDNKGVVTIAKDDKRRRAFVKMSDALKWTKADKDLIAHFVEAEASKVAV